jgi:opacity protein-like surface antigen
VRGEYRYTSYGTAEFMHGGPSEIDLATQAVTAGVSFRF